MGVTHLTGSETACISQHPCSPTPLMLEGPPCHTSHDGSDGDEVRDQALPERCSTTPARPFLLLVRTHAHLEPRFPDGGFGWVPEVSFLLRCGCGGVAVRTRRTRPDVLVRGTVASPDHRRAVPVAPARAAFRFGGLFPVWSNAIVDIISPYVKSEVWFRTRDLPCTICHAHRH
jgi:hypothetical protein